MSGFSLFPLGGYGLLGGKGGKGVAYPSPGKGGRALAKAGVRLAAGCSGPYSGCYTRMAASHPVQ